MAGIHWKMCRPARLTITDTVTDIITATIIVTVATATPVVQVAPAQPDQPQRKIFRDNFTIDQFSFGLYPYAVAQRS